MPMTLTIPAPGSRARAVAVGLAATVALALILGPSLAPRAAQAVDGTPAEHSISVSGTGRVTLSPDVADVQLGVLVQRQTVKAARADAATAMTAVIAALKAAGIADADITTTTLSLQPQYDYSNSGAAPHIIGYQFSNGVKATVRKIDAVGDVIDGAIAAGATSLDGVTFRVDDETRADAQARSAAVADAKTKADALAAAAGVSINGVISISETVTPVPYPIPYAALDSGGKSVATPVQPGTTDVTISVSVVYRIP
ncbi:MAG: SIMPL domain-containing protein [Candidatus Limnocylindrales bacterium]